MSVMCADSGMLMTLRFVMCDHIVGLHRWCGGAGTEDDETGCETILGLGGATVTVGFVTTMRCLAPASLAA